MGVTNISELNQKWGICGFASSLAALYESNKVIRTTIDTASSKGHLNTRLLAEIKTYLVILKSENKTHLLKDIENYTRSFPGYGTFSIDGFIKAINRVPTMSSLKNIHMTKDFSIAMPPDAVLDYLRRIGGFKGAREIPKNKKKDNVILGLSEKGADPKTKPYKALGHWVFKRSDWVIYNWGEIVTLKDIFKTFDIVFQIAL